MGIKVDGHEVETLDGVVTLTDNTEKFKNGLEAAELDMNTVKKVRDYETDYMKKQTEAATETATKIFKENEDVNKVIVVDGLGGALKNINHTTIVKRSVTFKNPTNGEEITKPTVVTATKRPGVPKSKLRALSSLIADSLAD